MFLAPFSSLYILRVRWNKNKHTGRELFQHNKHMLVITFYTWQKMSSRISFSLNLQSFAREWNRLKLHERVHTTHAFIQHDAFIRRRVLVQRMMKNNNMNALKVLCSYSNGTNVIANYGGDYGRVGRWMREGFVGRRRHRSQMFSLPYVHPT